MSHLSSHRETMPTRHRLIDQTGNSKGRVTFTSADSGDHVICLSISSEGWWTHTTKTRIHLDLLFGEPEDSIEISKQDVYGGTQSKVRTLHHRVLSIQREQEYQRMNEAEFRNTSEIINSHVLRWTIAQVAILAVTCMWQIRHLKNFFITKKLV